MNMVKAQAALRMSVGSTSTWRVNMYCITVMIKYRSSMVPRVETSGAVATWANFVFLEYF